MQSLVSVFQTLMQSSRLRSGLCGIHSPKTISSGAEPSIFTPELKCGLLHFFTLSAIFLRVALKLDVHIQNRGRLQSAERGLHRHVVVKIGDTFAQINHHLIAEFGVVEADTVEQFPDFDVGGR